jgi:signal transduction histidine kinase/pSer/pThr/pTyr-binding forkhead associated (FHA) protein
LTRKSQHYEPFASLVPVRAETLTQIIELGKAETMIGRDASNQIQIAHDTISRFHAKISQVGGQYELTDLKSRNGTFVNRLRTERAVLHSGDMIHFGSLTFLFKLKSPVAPATPARTRQETSRPADSVSITDDADVDPSNLSAQSADLTLHTFLQPTETKANDRIYMLYRMGEKFRSCRASNDILHQGLDLIFEGVTAAEHAVALLRTEETSGPFEVRAVRSRDGKQDGLPIPISRTVLDWVTSERVAVVSKDASEDARFESSNSIRVHDLKSIVCVPMMNDQKVVGAVHLDSRDFLNPLTAVDMEFVAAVANEMAVWIENNRLQLNVIRNERMAAIGMTVTDVAHNIKNLLFVSANEVKLMDQDVKNVNNENIHSHWNLIRPCIERMNGLAKDMLAFARTEPLKKAWIDVNAALYDNRELFEKPLKEANIHLEWDLAPDLPEFLLDAAQLDRVILNLLINAKDALRGVSGGIIIISTSMDRSHRLNISVSDNGCGIKSEDINKVFRPFFTTKGTGGSGLGLPMVQKFMEGVNGRVEVESEPMKGSALYLIFPPSIEGQDAAHAE